MLRKPKMPACFFLVSFVASLESVVADPPALAPVRLHPLVNARNPNDKMTKIFLAAPEKLACLIRQQSSVSPAILDLQL
jgi:hypothetical protein